MKKKMPILIICLLLLILFFIGGVQYGKWVEVTNKKITTTLSVSPIPSITQTVSQEGFQLYENQSCSMSLLIPSQYQIQKESSQSASFIKQTEVKEGLTIFCYPRGYIDEDTDLYIASNSSPILDKSINSNLSIRKDNKSLIKLVFIHPKSGKTIIINASENLLPLFEKTIRFL